MLKTLSAIAMSLTATPALAASAAPPTLHLKIVYSLVVPNIAEVGLRQRGDAYRIYASRPPLTSCNVRIDEATAADLVSTWQRAMSGDARWRGENGLDGETYEFTASGPPIPLHRSIWSPNPETFPGRLVDLSDAMARYCAKPSAQGLAALRAKSKALSHDLIEADRRRDPR